MPSGPGVIPEGLIREIARKVPPAVSSVLLTSKQDAHSIIAQHRRVGTNALQICDRLVSGTYDEIHDALRGVSIIQVIHIAGLESVEEALSIAPHIDGILLDSGNRSSAVKELGGTGRTYDWSISKKIKERLSTPLFLAGGLNPSNVAEAIRQVQPFAVDVCSGVRTDGALDETKLSEFFNQIQFRVFHG